MRPAYRDERGAIIIQVAVVLLTLIALTAFIVDFGIMWVSRRQAQNAADAAALAGAISYAREGKTGTDADLAAAQSAREWAKRNAVWDANNTDGNVDVTVSGTNTGACVAEYCVDNIPPCGTLQGCVRVDVLRNAPRRALFGGGTAGSAIPTFFGHLIGINGQRVRATATAQPSVANTTDCLKPWAIVDKWDERRPTTKTWEPTDTFDKWEKQGPDTVLLPDPVDYYEAPTASSAGTGFNPTTDLGLQVMLKIGSGGAADTISSGWFKAIDLPCASGNVGADCYRENIYSCTTQQYSIGDTLDVNTQQGVMAGPTEQGVMGSNNPNDPLGLYQRDPDARWVKEVAGSPYVPGQPQPGEVKYSAYASSPRIVPVPVINIDSFFASDPNGQSTVTIVNILGMFIEGTCSANPDFEVESYIDCSGNNGAVVGRLVRLTGLKTGGAGPVVGPQAAWMSVIQLVR
jgi:Flp pilus assembly protein TadG